MANSENIRLCKDIVLSSDARTFVVVSAPGRCPEHANKMTDLLIDAHTKMCHQNDFSVIDDVLSRFTTIASELGVDISAELERTREEIQINKCNRDFIISRGEYIMAVVFSKFCDYKFLDASEYIVIKRNGEADIEQTRRNFSRLDPNGRYVIGGFFGRGVCGGIKTFDRGGSDYTGAVVSVCLGANVYENFTDTNGVQSANPAIVKNTKSIKELDFSVLYKLCCAGASVIYPSCVPLLKKYGIPLKVYNTFDPSGAYTTVSEQKPVGSFFSITYATGANINKDTTDILCVTNRSIISIETLREIFTDITVYMTSITSTEIRLLTPLDNTSKVVNLLHKAMLSNI
ncbi:MAG: hypothetical protein FWC00_05030 [Firmicutes bacterium]|nr:hypothetical protein [Bacillota bacterium]